MHTDEGGGASGSGEGIAGLRRYLVAETLVGSGMNIVMSLAANVASGGGRIAPPPLPGVLAQTFMVGFMGVLLATLLTRMRQRRGRCAFGHGMRLGLLRRAPHGAFPRALLAGAGCLLVASPIVVVLLPRLLAAGPGPLETGVATAGYALLLSLLTIPPALLLELTGQPARR